MGRRKQAEVNLDALRAEKTELVLKYLCTMETVSKSDREKALARVKEIRALVDGTPVFEEADETSQLKSKRKHTIKRKKH